MKAPQDIIIAPVITEKSMLATGAKKYTFKVATGAEKIEIARAVEAIFSVKVAKVNTIKVLGRKKRMGNNFGYTPEWKKAVVTLTPDSKGIEFFESMS